MRTILIVVLVLAGAFLFSHQQSPTNPPSLPRDRTLEAEIRKNVGNLRTAFYLITNAYVKGRTQEVFLIYRDILADHPNDPLVKAEYVYVYERAVGYWQLPRDRAKVANYFFHSPYSTEADRLRAESVAVFKDKPEMYAMLALYNLNLNQRKYDVALVAAQKAVKLDPKWGFAHYLLGYCREGANENIKESKIKIRNANRTLEEFAIAQRLEPNGPFDNLNYGYIYAYSDLHRFREAIPYVDKAISNMEKRSIREPYLTILQKWRKSIIERGKAAGHLSPDL